METLSAYIPIDRRRALARGEDLPQAAEGAVLFADISGFTPLTEALARVHGPRRGADELTRHLNRVYGALVSEIHNRGGSVVGFSGDAITCWFAGSLAEATGAAVAAATAMQAAMAPVAALTVGNEQIVLAIKVAIAAGRVRRFVVGDPAIQLIDVLAGSPLERMAQAEHAAQKNEILLDTVAAQAVSGSVNGTWRTIDTTQFWVVQEGSPPQVMSPTPSLDEPVLDEPVLVDALALPWILPALHDRMQGGHAHYLAESRPAAALFLSFDGIDYEGDPDAGAKLNAFVRRVQAIVHRYEGALIQLTTGDKGSYLYVAFGAPIAHDDDSQRAVAVALTLRQLTADGGEVQNVRIGISQGRMRVGAYGSEARRTYGVLGDEVNLAARLMGKAEPGQILVSQRVAEAVAAQYRLQRLGPVAIKGKREPLEIFAVEAERSHGGERFTALFATELVGRQRELAQFDETVSRVLAGKGQIVRLVGSAGVGKSHLAAAFAAQAQQRSLQLAIGSSQSTEQDVAYAAIRPIARQLLQLNEEEPVAAQVAAVTAAVEAMNPDWLLRLPLLGDLLGLPIADSAATAGFDPQLRQEALIALAVEIVHTRARRQPLLLLLEDVHWIDEASRRMVLALARVIADVPILLLLVHRPLDGLDDGLAQELSQLPHQSLVALHELDSAGEAELARQRLDGPLSPLALSLIVAQTQGNPFFTEELIDALLEGADLVKTDETWTLSPSMTEALRRADCLTQNEDEQWVLVPDTPLTSINLGLPDSIHGLVLSRLDRLPEPPKVTLKVASVIGRVFDVDLLARAHPIGVDESQLLAQLEALNQRDFARLERPQPRLAYIFKHHITQEVVYRTLLESQQQALHVAVATQLEALRPGAVEQLAFHYHQGDLARPEVRAKALHYLGNAAEKAKREYANETALSYLDRALALEIRWEWLAAKVDVLHILGRRVEEEATLQALAHQAEAPAVEVYTRQGAYAEALSDYPAAEAASKRALVAARAASDQRAESKALSKLGMIAWRQGEYDAAAEWYHHALTVLATGEKHEREEAEVRYGLGLLYRDRSEYDRARAEFEQVLLFNRTLDDRQQEARTLSALASIVALQERNYGETVKYNSEALRIYQMIGDRAGQGASLLNLAQSANSLGNYEHSLELLQKSLTLQQALGDRWWEMIVWNELGIVYMLLGQYPRAEQALQQALYLCHAIEANAAYILCNLGQVFREQGKWSTTQQTLLEGYELALAQDEKYLQALYLSDLALLAMEMGNFTEAIEKASLALQTFQKMEILFAQPTELTTLARAWLALGDSDQAQQYADSAIQILDECSGEGPDFPHRDYLRCYQIFHACNRPADALRTLTRAHELLLVRSEKLYDPELRYTFMHAVPFNREILIEVEKQVEVA